MMPADFAPMAPRSPRPLVAGDNGWLAALHGPDLGRTDAGRPDLPRTLEVVL